MKEIKENKSNVIAPFSTALGDGQTSSQSSCIHSIHYSLFSYHLSSRVRYFVHFRLQTRGRSNKFVKIFSWTEAKQEKYLFLEEERLESKMRAVSFLLLLHSVFYATALNKDGCRIVFVFVFMILPRIMF